MSVFTDVADFNREIIGLEYPNSPRLLSEERFAFRAQHMAEELAEIIDAQHATHIENLADGIADLVYVALGLAHEMGIDMQKVWDEVQRANMAKKRGNVSKRPGSQGYDAVKPDGWQAPNHAWLTTQMIEADVEERDSQMSWLECCTRHGDAL